MPIYGYLCQNCGHSLDALQKVSDDPLVDCPECGAAELKRQLSAPRFRLKGAGWYETDFKKDKQRNLAGDRDAAKKDDAKADAKEEKKSDADRGGARETTADKPEKKAKSDDAKPASKSTTA